MLKRLLKIGLYILGGLEISIIATPVILYSVVYWILTGKDKFTDILGKSINWLDYLETKLN